MSDKILNIYIKNNNPIELSVLSNSLTAFSYLYASFIEKNNLSKDFEPKLYIKEIKDGSVDLYLYAGLAYTLLSGASDPTLDFWKQLIDLMKYFLGENSEKPKECTVKEIENFAESLDLIARDPKSSQKIQIQDTKGNVYQGCTFNFDSTKANAMQNSAIRYIEEDLKQKTPEFVQDVPMIWADANFISNKQHGKVIIERINRGAKKVIFLNESDRSKCTNKHPDYPNTEWQNLIYRVDVKAIYMIGELRGYEILKVYDGVLPLEDE